MRLVATEYMSLDGVFEEPGHWSFPFFDDQAAAFKFDELRATDALLLGRNTYEGFAKAWPTMEGTGDFGVKMNTMPKYIVSSTLKDPAWSGSKVIALEDVRALKAQAGQDLLLSGSAQLFNALMREDLIDLYRIMLHPVVIGQGKQLFSEGGGTHNLELKETRRFPKGIIVLEYEREAKA